MVILIMPFTGKILIAKEKNPVSAIKVNVPPTSKDRFTGERSSVPAGSVVMCVYEHLAPENAMSAKASGQPVIPYLFILYGEKTWEANPHSYGIVTPSEVLKGKTVCFTGEDKAGRPYWKAVVEACGGTNVSGISRDTSFLVMADKNSKSTKAQSASKYGTTCLSYLEFQKMIESS